MVEPGTEIFYEKDFLPPTAGRYRWPEHQKRMQSLHHNRAFVIDVRLLSVFTAISS